jgi:hypothetical protein
MERISGRSLAARLFGASPARTLALLEAAWPLAVGPELARRTEVLGIEGGTLRIRVPDAGWRKVLHRMQPQILAHLREIAGELAPKRMGFVEGGVGAPEAITGGPRVRDEQPTDASPGINTLAATIDDTEIRTRFIEVATRYLERSKGRSDA